MNRIFLVTSFLLIAGSIPAEAQIESPAKPTPVGRDTLDAGRNGQDLVRRANQFLVRRDAESAIPLLEQAYQNDSSPVVAERLQRAYEQVGRYDDAFRLLDIRLRGGNPSAFILGEKGRLQYRAGHVDAATQTWEEALSRQQHDGEAYRLVSEAARQAEAYELALDILEQGRKENPNDDTLLIQLALVTGDAGDPASSIGHYLAFLERRPDQVGFLKSRLTRQLGNPETPAVFRAAIDNAVKEDPFNIGYRDLSAWLALSEGDFEVALDAALAIDRISNENGETVLSYAKSAAKEGALDAAERALADLLTRHADGPVAASARLERARVTDLRARQASERVADGRNDSTATPLTDAARDAYEEFLNEHPGHPEANEGRKLLAGLYRRVYGDSEAAEELLTGIAETSRNPLESGQALLDLGDAAILQGDLYEARTHFESVKDRVRTGDLADEARFELARIDFYEGFFFTALSRLEALDDNTAASVSNDAISLRVTLKENIDPDSTADALSAYARASLLIRRHREEEAIQILDSLATASPRHIILDDVAFTKAAAHLASGNATESARLLELLPDEFPQSFFVDRALLLLGEIRENHFGDPDGAQEAYLRLLEDYPGSLFAPRARDRVRTLRGEAPNS